MLSLSRTAAKRISFPRLTAKRSFSGHGSEAEHAAEVATWKKYSFVRYTSFAFVWDALWPLLPVDYAFYDNKRFLTSPPHSLVPFLSSRLVILYSAYLSTIFRSCSALVASSRFTI